MKYGIDFQSQIDFCGIESGFCVLSIVQSDIIDDSNLELLQIKLNHYLTYILDGQLEKEDPQKNSLPKRIDLILGHTPTEELKSFILKLIPILDSENIGFNFKTVYEGCIN